MELVAHASRDDGWWSVEVPEVPGLFTQARRLDQIEAMVRDAASLLTGDSEESFEVTVVPVLGDEVASMVVAVKDARARLRAAEAEAAAANRTAAATLAAEGLTVRDIGTILDISFQRAQYLVKAA
jgi:predicted RNase H-like HicB family nuclease